MAIELFAVVFPAISHLCLLPTKTSAICYFYTFLKNQDSQIFPDNLTAVITWVYCYAIIFIVLAEALLFSFLIR